MSRISIAFIVAVTIVIGAAPNTSIAQGLSIEEVVVTARRIEENIQDTPIAVTALSGAELDLRGALDTTSIADSTPNLFFEQGGGPSGSSSSPSIFIRGIGQSDFLITSEPGVGLYLDGVYISRTTGALFDLMDVERVEVLRGPQGTLFGRNTIGGAIQVVSKKPHDQLELDAEVTFGEDNWYGARGTINFPITDTVSGRVSGMFRKRDGYVEAVNYDDVALGDDDVWAVRGQIRWEPTDNLTIDMSADYTQEREAPAPFTLNDVNPQLGSMVRGAPTPAFPGGAPMAPASDFGIHNFYISGDPACINSNSFNPAGPPFVTNGLTLGGNNPNCYGDHTDTLVGRFEADSVWHGLNGEIVEPKNKLDVIGFSMDVQWETPILDFRSITSYRGFDMSTNNDLDFSRHVIFENYNENFDQKQWSQEFTLTGSLFDDHLDWTTGFYVSHENGEENVTLIRTFSLPGHPLSGMFVNPGREGVFFTDSRKITNDSAAWYGQATVNLFDDRLHLTGGLRFTDDEKEFGLQIADNPVFFRVRPDATQADGLAGNRIFGEQKLSKWTPMINVAFDVNDDVMLYLTYSEGFRVGGFPPRVLGQPENVPSYGPEEVEVIEGGIKSRWWDGRATANLSIFDTSYSDYQALAVPDTDDPALRAAGVLNLADASLFGVEFEGQLLPTESLRIDVSIGYLENDIDSILGDVAFSDPFYISDTDDLPYAPEWTSSLGASYYWPLKSGGEMFLRADWIYSGSYFIRVENDPFSFQEDYSQVNASVNYRHPGDQWEVKLAVQNLTDEFYQPTGFRSTVCSCSARRINRGRTVYGTISYSWGE